MKTCPKCGINYPDDKEFCKKDGTPLVDRSETRGHEMDLKYVAQKSVFKDRLKAEPLNVSILYEYAQFLFNKNHFKEAIVTLHKILVIKEDDTAAQSLLYKSYLNFKNPDEAFSIGAKLLNFNPHDEFLLADLGNIAYNSNKFEEAVTYFDKALSINPDNKELWIKKAYSLKNINKPTQALSAWQKVYELDNNHLQARYYVGISKVEQKDYNNAIILLEPTINKINNEEENNLAKLYFLYSATKLNRKDQDTIRIFESIDKKVINRLNDREVNNIYFELLVYFGNLYLAEPIYRDTNLLKAISCFTKALNIDKNSISAKNSLGNANYKNANNLFEDKQYATAKSYIEDALKLVPENKEYEELSKKINEVISAKKKKLIILRIAAILLIIVVIATIYFINYQKQENTWNTAKKENTYASYLKYITEYSKGKYLNKAKELQETALWNEALKKNVIQSYDNYIKLYASGKYVNEAKAKREDVFWNAIKNENTAQAYNKYISEYKDGKYAQAALNTLERLGAYKALKRGLIAYYPLNGNVKDESGNKNNGTVYGATLTTDRYNNPNKAYLFNGIDNYIEIPNAPSLNPSSLTISAWVKISDLAGRHNIIFKRNKRINWFEGYSLLVENSQIRFIVSSASDKQVSVGSKNNLALNQWYNVIATANSTKVRLFVNGILQDSKNTGFVLDYDNLPLYIGRTNQSQWEGFYNGVIDDVCIFNRVLKDEEINLLYNLH